MNYEIIQIFLSQNLIQFLKKEAKRVGEVEF